MSRTLRRRIPIVCDNRETRSGIIARLQADDRFTVTVEPLEVGDYWVDRAVLIERKGLQDFYRSIFSGKIFRQLSELRRASSRCLLLVEGLHRSPAFARAPRWLTGALLSMSAGFQVPMLSTRDPEHTAETLYLLALQQAQEAAGIPRVPKLHSRTAVDRWLRNRVLQAVPQVGPKRASALLDAFETLGAIFTAPPERLAEVNGVGLQTAGELARLGLGVPAPGPAPAQGPPC